MNLLICKPFTWEHNYRYNFVTNKALITNKIIQIGLRETYFLVLIILPSGDSLVDSDDITTFPIPPPKLDIDIEVECLKK